MQMWLSTQSTSDPVVEVRGEFYWVTRMSDSRFLVTRQRDATRVGVVSLAGSDIRAEDGNPETQALLCEVAHVAEGRKLIRPSRYPRNLPPFWRLGHLVPKKTRPV